MNDFTRWLAKLRGALVVGLLSACNSSPSYGTPQDCTAAGGQCIIGFPNSCAKEGPDNTCNCNPGCNPGGAFCCLAFVDAAADVGRDTAPEVSVDSPRE